MKTAARANGVLSLDSPDETGFNSCFWGLILPFSNLIILSWVKLHKLASQNNSSHTSFIPLPISPWIEMKASFAGLQIQLEMSS